MTALRAWFTGRSRREQRLLLAMAALALLTLVWAGIIRPIGDARSSARERHADAVLRLGATEARVAALRTLQRDRPLPLTGTLADAVRSEASAAGFTLASVTPDGDGLRVTIATARPTALVAWLARLERLGILVGAASLTDNGDHTVGVAVTLAARGA